MGYQTSVIGKWHMGTHPKFSPENYGFDYHYGITGAASYMLLLEKKILLSQNTLGILQILLHGKYQNITHLKMGKI